MYSEHARTAHMYVDYSGDAYAGMGIKAMKSFARPRGMELARDLFCSSDALRFLCNAEPDFRYTCSRLVGLYI